MWQPLFLFEVVFFSNRYMFVFEVFLLLATFLVNSFDFVFFSYLWCDICFECLVCFDKSFRSTCPGIHVSFDPSLWGGFEIFCFHGIFCIFFFSIVEYISLRMFGDFDSLRRLGVLLRGILIWGFFSCLFVSTIVTPVWYVLLDFVSGLCYLVDFYYFGLCSWDRYWFFFVIDILTFVFHFFLCLAFYFFFF